jgi:hypothetical protein
MIAKCTCEHPFQDKMYGRNMRVFNENTSGKCRCTVCGKEFGVSTKMKEKETGKK